MYNFPKFSHKHVVSNICEKAFFMLMSSKVYCTCLYLWYTTNNFYVSEEKPNECAQLVTGERLPTHMDKAQLSRWIWDLCQKTPYLCVKDSNNSWFD